MTTVKQIKLKAPAPLHDQTSKHSQGYDRTRIIALADGRRLRTVLHIDTSYRAQSRAKIELWTPAGWTLVHSEPGEALPWPMAYFTPSCAGLYLDEMVAKLEQIALAVVGE